MAVFRKKMKKCLRLRTRAEHEHQATARICFWCAVWRLICQREMCEDNLKLRSNLSLTILSSFGGESHFAFVAPHCKHTPLEVKWQETPLPAHPPKKETKKPPRGSKCDPGSYLKCFSHLLCVNRINKKGFIAHLDAFGHRVCKMQSMVTWDAKCTVCEGDAEVGEGSWNVNSTLYSFSFYILLSSRVAVC